MTRPRKTLELKVDRGLEITAVRLQDSSLPLRASAESGDGPIAVSVQLPEEFSEATATLQISATADWPTKDRAVAAAHATVGRSVSRRADGRERSGLVAVASAAGCRLCPNQCHACGGRAERRPI